MNRLKKDMDMGEIFFFNHILVMLLLNRVTIK